MSRTYTVAELITRAKRKADLEDSTFVGAAEWLDNFNSAYTELYDLLIESGQNYFYGESTISVSSATGSYSLPADFYKLLSFNAQIATNNYVTLDPFNESERNAGLTSSLPTVSVLARYVPQPPKVTDTATAVDGIAGYEELIVLNMAIDAGMKEETDVSALVLKRDRLTKRITDAAAMRDMSQPGRVVDIHARNQQPYRTLRYKLNGNTVHFINREAVGGELLGW